MRKLLALIIVVSMTSSLYAQGQPSENHGKFKKAKTGLQYRIDRASGSKKKPLVNDILSLNLSYYLIGVHDSLIMDSRTTPQKMMNLQLTEPVYKGDIMDAIALLETGDSATFIVSADSFFLKTAKMPALPSGIKQGSSLIFHVGLTGFKTLSELQSEQAKEDSLAQIQSLMKRDEEFSVLQAYLGAKGITQTPTSSGLIIVPVTEGTGEKPAKGQKVFVHYSGYLLNGEKFDSSVDKGEPFSFTLGASEVIPGWDEGVAQIKPGGSVQLIIPSALGYGASGIGPIPPFSTLVFDVQLLKVE